MPANMYYIGVLCITYFASRAIGWIVGRVKGQVRSQQRVTIAHLVTAGLITPAILLFRSFDPFAALPYLVVQAGWWAVDWARSYRPRKQSRIINPLRWRHVGSTIAAVMALTAISYIGSVFTSFKGDSSSLGGLPLGVSHGEVLYAGGVPTLSRRSSAAPFERGGDVLKSSDWLYSSPPILVRFDEHTGISTLAECVRPTLRNQAGCPSSFLVGVGSFDRQVSDRLGSPTAIVVAPGTKLMRYPELGRDYVLKQYMVQAVRAYPETGDRIRKYVRLIRYAIP